MALALVKQGLAHARRAPVPPREEPHGAWGYPRGSAAAVRVTKPALPRYDAFVISDVVDLNCRSSWTRFASSSTAGILLQIFTHKCLSTCYLLVATLRTLPLALP